MKDKFLQILISFLCQVFVEYLSGILWVQTKLKRYKISTFIEKKLKSQKSRYPGRKCAAW